MLLTKQHLVNTVDDRWKKQYYRDDSWNYYGDDKVEKYEDLVNLGKIKNTEDVDKIANTEVFKDYEAVKEAIADFIYELDSAGANI